MLDVETVREDFPILDQEVNGKPLVYFDNAATSQKPESVIEAESRYYRQYNSNVHRGAHTLSDRATQAYEDAREAVASFLNAPHSREVVFTGNTTEGINLVARSWAESELEPGDEILLTVMEHHSNLIPWQLVAQRTGARLEFVELTEDGELDRDSFEQHLGERTRIVALTHMSNVLGTITPVRELTELAHDAGALVLVDGAQSVPHMPVDVQQLGCDFLAFSGHKMCGPTGIGVLYAREQLLEDMPPFLGGGEMIGRVELRNASWADLPHKFEAGTPKIAQAVGLHAAIDYLRELGMDRVREHEEELVKDALEAIEEVPGVSVFGHATKRGGVISFAMDGVHPHDLSQILDEHGVAIRAGHHCAQPLMEWLGVAATARASLYFYNKKSELQPFLDGLDQAKEFFDVVAV